MTGIALLLAAAAVAYALAKALRVPSIPMLLLAGVALAQTGRVPADFLEESLILGVTFLLFITGIELSPRRTGGQRNAAIRVGLVQFTILGLAGLALALSLGHDVLSAAYVALALTASSTLVVVRLLRRRRRMFEPFARLVIGVLLLQDLLVIALIPLMRRAPAGIDAVVYGLLSVSALFLLAGAAWRWIGPLMTRLDGDDEALLLATLALLFVFIGLADWLQLPLVVGALLAGITLSGFPVDALVRPQLASIGDFFSAIFFTALGALIGIPSGLEIFHALIFALLLIVLTPPLVTIVAEMAGLSARPAIESGLLLAQASELSLVVGLYGMLEGQISQSVFTVIALMTLLTMLLTPLIATDRVAWMLMHLHPVRRRARTLPPLTGHVLVLGSGSTGMPLLETLLGADYEVVVVDDDPDVVARLRDAELHVIRGDASDVAVLRQARAREARVITSTIRRPEDNRRLLEYAGGVPVIVRVFEEEDADWIRELGGTPVLYSHAASEGLMQWIEKSL